MSKKNILFFLTFVLAFCSIVYELILAQALSAFLENTVLRFSVTIGLYMFSMGVGSLLVKEEMLKKPAENLLKFEILLTLLGGFSLILLYWIYVHVPIRGVFTLAAHGLIMAIGFLTGFELPLLLALNKDKNTELMIGLNYFGAFAGTLVFAFLFYRYAGLVVAAFVVGLLNGVMGLLISFCFEVKGKLLRFVPVFIIGVLIVCILNSSGIEEYLTRIYLN